MAVKGVWKSGATLVLVGLLTLSATGWAKKSPSVVPADKNAEGWIALFNGIDTYGWETVGSEAEWSVTDGVLKNVGTGDGWLSTVATFADFELIVEWKVSKGGNSGIFFRAGHEGRPWVNGYESQIDEDDAKNPTGSIYNRLPAKKPNAPDEQWNTTEISAKGDHLIVKINGEEVVNGKDATFASGRIGLQMHDASSTVEYRKVWVRPVGLVSRWNGKDFTGWKVKRGNIGNPEEAKFELKDGVVRISGGPGYLESVDKAGNFHARFKVMTEPRDKDSGNSGVFIRGPIHPGEDFNKWPEGLEAQVFNELDDFTTGGWYHFVKAKDLYSQNDEWFWMDINAVENRYQTWVNGMPAGVWVDPKSRYKDGIFALQAHDPKSILYYSGAEWNAVEPHVDKVEGK